MEVILVVAGSYFYVPAFSVEQSGIYIHDRLSMKRAEETTMSKHRYSK